MGDLTLRDLGRAHGHPGPDPDRCLDCECGGCTDECPEDCMTDHQGEE